MANKSADTTETKEKTPAVAETAASTDSRKSIAEHLFRFSTVDTDSADDDAKTIQVCFSSEELVLRKATEYDELLGIAPKGTKYWELLSHRKGECDFSELDGGKGTVLDEHEDSLQLGKVPRAKRSKDNVGRAVLKFDGLSELSNTRYEQMKRGERTGISTGYWHTKFIADEGEKDGYPIKRLAWAADEISSVRNAADKNRAGVRRSAEGQWACLCCGNMFDRAKLDENFECGCENEIRAKKDAIKTRKARKADDFKFTRDAEDEISFSDLRDMVSAAADSDKRFKSKRENGDVFSAFFVDDICLDQDTGDWTAVIFNWADGTFWCVEFEIDGESVTLGEAEEVRPETNFVPVNRSATPPSHATPPVDSPKLSITGANRTGEHSEPTIQKRNFMAKTIAELKTEAPELVTAIETETRTATEKNTRAAITAEFKGEGKRAALVKEIRALANEFVKTHGQNWAGKPGEVVVVGERIRAFEQEALQTALTDETRGDSEIRSDFKNRANEIIRESRAPKNFEEAGTVEQDLADQCSLKRMWDMANKDFARGVRKECYLLADGAEFEADKELRHKASEFPGGLGYAPGGQLFPANMRGHIDPELRRLSRKHGGKLTRDALLSDYPSLGALVPPEYMTPIELLRNKVALVNAGVQMISGVVGNPLTFPRLAASTTAQSLAEGAALNSYDQVFDQIKLTPHRIGSMQNYSRLGMSQAPGFEAIVWDDHMQVHARKADYLGLNGSGAGDEPLGILNTLGINPVVFGGSAANAFKNIFGPAGLETLIRKANIDEAPTFMSTSVGRGSLIITPATLTGSTVVSGSTAALLVNDRLGGRNFVDSQQIPGDILLAIVARHILFATWAGMNVVLDTITRADRDQFRLTVNQYIDWGLRHPQAVARSVDSIAALA